LRRKIFDIPKYSSSVTQIHTPPIPKLSNHELRSLRGVFELNNYSSDPSVEDTAGPTSLKMLFAHGRSVSIEEAITLFHPLDLDVLIRSGLLIREGEQVKALFQAQPYHGLIFFSDFFEWENSSDFVLPIGPAGHYLANLTIRRKASSALDLGCGCGIQSLMAARHCEHVTATDVNPRALALTRLNADLNGIGNIKTSEGSYFEPVNYQKFELIVANLPYVITPENSHVYKDVTEPGGMGLRTILTEIPNHLTEDGFSQILINWVHRNDEDWWQPLQQALANTHSDAWLIYTASKQPEDYADIWIDRKTRNNPTKFKKTKREWLDWYKAYKIHQIALGAVILRRRSASDNWFLAAKAKENLESSASEQLLRMFGMQDLLNSLENSIDLMEKILVPQDLELISLHSKEQALISQARGLRLETKVAQETLAVLHQLDRHVNLREAIHSITTQPEFATFENQDLILADIRVLLQFGMLVMMD
jgi:ubiquinone/menaquinone biosynthesis C-methylase UbiE